MRCLRAQKGLILSLPRREGSGSRFLPSQRQLSASEGRQRGKREGTREGTARQAEQRPHSSSRSDARQHIPYACEQSNERPRRGAPITINAPPQLEHWLKSGPAASNHTRCAAPVPHSSQCESSLCPPGVKWASLATGFESMYTCPGSVCTSHAAHALAYGNSRPYGRNAWHGRLAAYRPCSRR